MPPVIFLDIDGVLAVKLWQKSPRSHRSIPRAHRRPFQKHAPRPRVLSGAAVTHLNLLCQTSGALLVVSSSWRLVGDIRPHLAAHGVSGEFHDDWRTDADGPDRGAEIQRWIAKHGADNYVILDDWLPGVPGMSERLVQTNFKVGLQAYDCERAIGLLAATPR